MVFKTCSTCGLRQSLKHFDRRGHSSRDGYRRQCKRCLNGRGKAERDRDRHLRRKYGITLDQYKLLLAKQGSVCAICHGLNKNSTRLSVDHCHKTGKVRGLLCSECNRLIGAAIDEPTILLSAINYLQENK